LAAFTSEAVAPAGTRWVAQSQITSRDTLCAHEATTGTTTETMTKIRLEGSVIRRR